MSNHLLSVFAVVLISFLFYHFYYVDNRMEFVKDSFGKEGSVPSSDDLNDNLNGEDDIDKIAKLFTNEKFEEVVLETSRVTVSLIKSLPIYLQMKYHYIYGISLFRTFRYEEALNEISKCLTFNDKEEKSKIFKGLCFQGRSEIFYILGEHDKSLHDTDIAMEYNPLNLNDFNAKILYIRGINQIKIGQYQSGVKNLEICGNLYPKITKERYFSESLAKGLAELKRKKKIV